MSSGYTPVFRSIFEGSLCGQWPFTAGWLIFLALADKNGNVDMTPQYISKISGMPLDDLRRCIERFTNPDEESRTPDEQGRRLLPLDSDRPWGWKIVNHGAYREKARLMAKNAREVESGQNANRMIDRRRPPETAADHLSNTNTNTNPSKSTPGTPAAKSRKKSEPPEFAELRGVYPKRAGDQGWPKALKACHARIHDGHTWREIIDGATRYRDFCKATDKIGTEFVKQAATFCGPDKHFLQPWTPPPKPNGGKVGAPQSVSHEQRERQALDELMARRDAIGIDGFRDPHPSERASDYRLAQEAEWTKRKENDRKKISNSIIAKLGADALPDPFDKKKKS